MRARIIPLGPGGVAVEANGARFELAPDEYSEISIDEALAEEWQKTAHPQMSDFQMLCDEAELAGLEYIDLRKNNIRVSQYTDIFFLPKMKVFKVVRVKSSGRLEKLLTTELPRNAIRAAMMWTGQRYE